MRFEPARSEPPSGAPVARLASRVADAELVPRARAGDPSAIAALYDRHAEDVRRVLARVLGVDAELPDCLHETFARALEGLDSLSEPDKLGGWLAAIAVNVARSTIRRRQRARWLFFLAPEDVPEAPAPDAPPEVREALTRAYAALSKLPTEERIAFALRVLDGMELTEAATAQGTSLATFKRRLARAEERFAALARHDPVLRGWIDRADTEKTA